MPRFKVGLLVNTLEVTEVTADDSEEAVELAAQELFLDSALDNYDIEFVEEVDA